MTFHSAIATVRPSHAVSRPDPQRSVPAGILSRRELRRIIAEQID